MQKNGFTLIELLVCSAIIGVMFGMLGLIENNRINERVKAKAVEIGMGEYIMMDSLKGATEFKWKMSTNIPSPWLSATVTNSNKEVYIINIYKK